MRLGKRRVLQHGSGLVGNSRIGNFGGNIQRLEVEMVKLVQQTANGLLVLLG